MACIFNPRNIYLLFHSPVQAENVGLVLSINPGNICIII